MLKHKSSYQSDFDEDSDDQEKNEASQFYELDFQVGTVEVDDGHRSEDEVYDFGTSTKLCLPEINVHSARTSANSAMSCNDSELIQDMKNKK